MPKNPINSLTNKKPGQVGLTNQVIGQVREPIRNQATYNSHEDGGNVKEAEIWGIFNNCLKPLLRRSFDIHC